MTEQSNKEPSFKDLVDYLEVLGNGYVKPDLARHPQERVKHGVVRDTKKYFDFIDALNIEMCKRAGIEFPDGIQRVSIDD